MNGINTLGETATAWLDAQRKLVEQWSSTVLPGAAISMGNPVLEHWQQAVTHTMQTTNEPVAKTVGDQMVVGQEAMLKLMQMTADAWQTMMSQMLNGESWPAALQHYTEHVRTTLTGAVQSTPDTAQSVAQLWQTYLGQMQQWSQPWLHAGQQAVGPWSRVATGDTSALSTLTNLAWDAYHQTFGRLINTPTFGASREVNERQVAAFNAWVAVFKASSEFQVVTTDIWTKAFHQFMETLVTKAQAGETITSTKQFIDLWTDVAEQVFGEAFRSERYVDAQGKLLNATMEFQLRQRELTERAARAFGLPTKSDVDEAHKSIYQLRKDVKAIKKAQQQGKPDDSMDELRATQDELKGAHAELAKLQQTVDEMQASQPDLDTLMESLDDLRKQVKKLRKMIKDEHGSVSHEGEPKRRGKKRKEENM